MSDMNLLLFGIVVFGLMLIGVLFTVAEFRHLSNEDTSGFDTQPGSDGSSSRSPDAIGKPERRMPEKA